MQIFVVETAAMAVARSLCDKHVINQIGETAELLAIAHHRLGEGVPPTQRLKPRIRHVNHPCAKWVAETAGNYAWTWKMGMALCEEYTHRYGKVHAYQHDLFNMVHGPFCLAGAKLAMTPHPIVVPPAHLGPSVLESYRTYYQFKAQVMRMNWTRRTPPKWFDPAVMANSYQRAHA